MMVLQPDRSESKKVKLRQTSILEIYGKSLECIFSANFSSSSMKELIKLIDELKKELRREHPDLEFQ
jgi:hypothetical protein